MGILKQLLFDPDALFFFGEFRHKDDALIFIMQEELLEYVFEHSDSVSYDSAGSIEVIEPWVLGGGDQIPVDEVYEMTVGFIKEECGPA